MWLCRFYLSFENSFCSGYVTEKFYKGLSLDIIPVGRSDPANDQQIYNLCSFSVLGAAEYKNRAPPKSYINVLDYQSPKELAEFLLKLSADEEEYLSYFWWKVGLILLVFWQLTLSILEILHGTYQRERKSSEGHVQTLWEAEWGASPGEVLPQPGVVVVAGGTLHQQGPRALGQASVTLGHHSPQVLPPRLTPIYLELWTVQFFYNRNKMWTHRDQMDFLLVYLTTSVSFKAAVWPHCYYGGWNSLANQKSIVSLQI